MMHQLFAGRFIDPHLHLVAGAALPADAHDAGYAPPLGSNSVELPDNSEVLCVLQVSESNFRVIFVLVSDPRTVC